MFYITNPFKNLKVGILSLNLLSDDIWDKISVCPLAPLGLLILLGSGGAHL